MFPARIKICCIADPEEAKMAIDAGANAVTGIRAVVIDRTTNRNSCETNRRGDVEVWCMVEPSLKTVGHYRTTEDVSSGLSIFDTREEECALY